MNGSRQLAKVQKVAGAVVRKRGIVEHRRADIASEATSAALEALAEMSDGAVAELLRGDESDLWRLVDRYVSAVRRSQAAVDKLKSTRDYRSDEVNVRSLDVDNMTTADKRAIVGRFTHVDAVRAPVEILDAVLRAMVSAGAWDALALRPRHDASHVGHLHALLGQWSLAGRDRASADPFASVRGDLGAVLRATADAAPAWHESTADPRGHRGADVSARRARAAQRLDAFHAKRYRIGLRAFRAGNRSLAWAVVGSLVTTADRVPTADAPALDVDHEADAAAPNYGHTTAHRDGTTSTTVASVPWGAACAVANVPTDSATTQRVRRDAQRWGRTVRNRDAAERAAADASPAPFVGPVRVTGRYVMRYALPTAERDARLAHERELDRRGRPIYCRGLDAWHRGDKREAWAVVAYLANGGAAVAERDGLSGGTFSPSTAGTRDASPRGTSGAHVIRYGASGSVTHVPGDQSVLSDKRYR